MLLFFRMNIEYSFKGFFKACHHRVETVLRPETLMWMKQVDMERFRETEAAEDMQDTGTLAAAWLVSKATLQTGSDTGEGAQEVWGRAVMFSFLCVPIPSLTMALCQVKGGWREDGGRKGTNTVSQWAELNRAKRWLMTYTFGLEVRTVVVCWKSFSHCGKKTLCNTFTLQLDIFHPSLRNVSKRIMFLRIWTST